MILVICFWPSGRQRWLGSRRHHGKLKLTVNEKKTRVCKLPEEKFDSGYNVWSGAIPQKQGARNLGTVSEERVHPHLQRD